MDEFHFHRAQVCTEVSEALTLHSLRSLYYAFLTVEEVFNRQDAKNARRPG
jgi:hypothetical protein